ncbi:MAG: histidine triad family protein [Acidimicrobiaceae bacterium]|jgi:histidine triad (HIT) family protein|nr:histidine triad family protein [Acidimicrobiaceae bacterium]
MTDNCIFCAIVTGRAPARKVAEDDVVVAFLDIFPLTRGHALVVPKRHCQSLLDAPADDLTGVALMAQRLARVAVAPAPDGLAAEGVNLLQANGAVAYQTVFHLHVHVLPRYRGDGFKIQLDRRPGEEAELDATAGDYRRGLTA